MTTERESGEVVQRTAGPPKVGSKARQRWVIAGLVAASVAVACILVGVALGYRLAGRRSGPSTRETPAESGPTTWTCSMHPQIKLPKPGKCPICFMDLIPLDDAPGGDDSPRQLAMSKEAVALAEIQTTTVKRRYVTNLVRLAGKVDYDETRMADITAWVAGRLDRLYVDYTGVTVRKGDHLVWMYSPELVVTQRELLQSWQAYNRLGSERDKQLVERTLRSTEEKLRLLGLLEEQITEIKQRGTTSDHLTIYAPVGGIVIQKHANEGVYVQTGTKIYTIADLSQVWVYLDAYESDVPWLRYGQEAEFTTESYPGEIFQGRVVFIDPVLNEKTRTVRVRVNVPNLDLRLKPGMFVRAVVNSRLAAGGRVIDASLAGKWVSPMHPEIVKDGPGKCDICGMDLVPAEQLGFVVAEQQAQPPLVIPASAALITGKRAVVYVKLPGRVEPAFEGREVLLGHRAGDDYIVRHGLEEGEEVVTAGNFKIDSALQIQARPSMMSPEGGGVASGHDHVETAAVETTVPAAFRAGLPPLYRAYLAAADALAGDDLATARVELGRIPEVAAAIGAESLDSEGRSHWEQTVDRIVFAAYEAADARDLTNARRHFSALSLAMLSLVKTSGNPLPDGLHQIHCPMAFDNRGADWLQLGREVRNPYFGSQMLRCGEGRATFPSQAPLEVPDAFRQELAPVYAAYLKLQEALADDRLADALAAWEAMRVGLEQINSDSLDTRADQVWDHTRAKLAATLAVDPRPSEIEGLRASFQRLAGAMLGAVDAFGHPAETPLYEAYCPMAFGNKGAAWLQAGEKIANPYFGHKMLRCGEIRRRFDAPPAAAAREDRP